MNLEGVRVGGEFDTYSYGRHSGIQVGFMSVACHCRRSGLRTWRSRTWPNDGVMTVTLVLPTIRVNSGGDPSRVEIACLNRHAS